ncbi:S-layer homology domain-containing protein [Proteiniborus ethanoligenes]|uniref:S-layer homology domain-containing protein n=1 Tax=Proteiniborus ethanoligenes TaxID=415015 RepID=A0A1H3MXJ3_9FIRM|nr:S-layer homology domain-containing protein [Proteiniborus ethanoligenes]TAH63706.1 MAG: S-layer homology domain-containing protein [Gottschalkiaceae bacterium]SDY81228.1 S-layer homology domain-containing protein [Proteiniborus ethanoligenes]
MKKLISLVLVFSLLISITSVPAKAMNTERGDKVSPQMAQAYLDVIKSSTDTHGVAIIEDYQVGNSGGLYYADLIDFDGDGQKELYLLYAEDSFTHRDIIWGFNGSKAYIIGENTYSIYGTMNNVSIGLKQEGNKTYLCYEDITYRSDIQDDKEMFIEDIVFIVKEVEGKELKATANLYSILHYDESYERLKFEEYSEGENYENRKFITAEEYKEIYNKYSLNEGEILINNSRGAPYIEIYDYSLDDFINNLESMLMSSNMKDIYKDKSREEKMDIMDFLNNFRFFYHEEFDISNLDQEVLAWFMIDLLSREETLLKYEDVDLDDEKYEEWEEQKKYKEIDINKKAVELFGVNVDFQKHLPERYKDGYVYVHQPWDASSLFTTKINKIYPLGDNLFYIHIQTFETWDYDNMDLILNSLYEELPYNIRANFYQMGQGHAIIKAVNNEGKKSYQLIKYNKNGEYLTEEQLSKYITKVNPEPNLSFDYSKVKDFKESREFINFLRDIIAGLKGEQPNDRANSELVTYIQYAIENSSTTALKSSKNKVIIDKVTLKQALNSAESTKSEFNKILESNHITLNKNIEIVLRVRGENLNSNKVMSVIIDKSAVDSLGTANGIRILLGDNQHTVYINSEDVRNLGNKIGNITLQIQKGKDKGIYTIVFVDSNGKEISELPYPISFSFPADNELATIFVSYKGGNDNWGGQYNSTTKSIEFSTRYSGEYSIIENNINISDIGELTESQQKAIKFMVSKGYFELDGDKFNGQAPLNRYDFTMALVKMFFALDRELEATFTDIEKLNQYYPYVASAQKDQIVKGFTDNTFRGEINISKEQLIALCGRTLVDKKGYVYPENPKDYLGFVDSDSIADWAIEDIAIAVQNGLIDNGGILMPQMEMSRREGLEILYKLFMLLYETSPIEVEMEEIEQQPNSPIGIIIGSAIALVALFGGAYAYSRNKKSKKI